MEPRAGDAFGELMLAAHAALTGEGPGPAMEIVEREDGFINAAPADRYLAPPQEWPAINLRALEAVGRPACSPCASGTASWRRPGSTTCSARQRSWAGWSRAAPGGWPAWTTPTTRSTSSPWS